MRKTKRILCGVSAAALVFGSMSCYVASASPVADGTKIEASTTTLDGNYYLEGDVTLTNTLKVDSGKTATIDLCGHKLTGKDDALVIEVAGTLEITDSGSDGTIIGKNSKTGYNIVVKENGVLKWTKGNYEDTVETQRDSSIAVKSGEINITGGKFTCTNGTIAINLRSGDDGQWKSKASISGATITSNSTNKSDYSSDRYFNTPVAIHFATQEQVTVSNCNITGTIMLDPATNDDGGVTFTDTKINGVIYSSSDGACKTSATFDEGCTFNGKLGVKENNKSTLTFNGGEVAIDKVNLNSNTAEEVMKFGENVTLKLSSEAKTALANYLKDYNLVEDEEGNFVNGYTVTAKDAENGSIEVTKDTVAAGTEVTVTVKPADGYELDKLTVNDGDVTATEGEDGTYTFEMPAKDVTVSATFKEITYNVTVDTTTNGKVTLSSESAVKDEEVTVTVKPDTGYELDTLTVTDKDGKDVTTTKTTDGCKFNMPEGGATVKATFKKSETPTYTVTVSEEDKNGTVEVTPENAPAGDTVAVKVTPADGYELDTLTVTDEKGNEIETTVTSDGYSFKMPEGKVTVTAAFKEKKAEDSGSSGSGSSGSTTTPTTPSTEEFPDEESGVVATADEGVVPDGAELTVTPVADETDGTKVTLDICFKDGKGVEVQPNGKVTVKVPVPTVFKEASKVYVYREETNGTYTDMKAEVKDGLVVFTTDHFSKYVITTEQIKTNAPAADNDKADNTTPDANPNTGIALGLAPVLLAGTVTVVCARRKK